MSLSDAISICFSKYADFKGRARRSEYWWFWLFLVLCNAVLSAVDSFIGSPIIGGIFALATIVPSISVAVRRLHDTDRSGWWLLAPLAPLVLMLAPLIAKNLGSTVAYVGIALMAIVVIVQIVWLATDTQPGPNRFGLAPK